MENIVCNKDVDIIYENTDIKAVEKMFEEGCGILYVVKKNGQYVGCITRKEMVIGKQRGHLIVNENSLKIKSMRNEDEKVRMLFSVHSNIQNIPVVDENGILSYEYMRKIVCDDFDSRQYWEERYRNGGTSGEGSYNRLAEFKAKVLNDFVQCNNIKSIRVVSETHQDVNGTTKM